MSFLGGQQLSVSRSCMSAIVLIVIGSEISRSLSAGRFPLRTHTHIHTHNMWHGAFFSTTPFNPLGAGSGVGARVSELRAQAHKASFCGGSAGGDSTVRRGRERAPALPGQRAPSQPQFLSVTFYSSSYFPLHFRPPDLFFFLNHYYFNFFFRRQEGVWIFSPMPCERRAPGAAVELAGAQDAQRMQHRAPR